MASSARAYSAESLVFPLLQRLLDNGSDELATVTDELNLQRIVMRAEQKNLESTMAWVAGERMQCAEAGLAQRLAVQQAAIHLLDRLIVSAERLKEATDRKSGLQAIHDVLANVVGVEQFAVYEVDQNTAGTARLVAYCSDVEPPETVGEDDLAALVLRTGKRACTKDDHLPTSTLPQLLCSPLFIENEVKFLLIAIQLLPQMETLRGRDVPILDLLEKFAASALVREREDRQPQTWS